MSHGDSQSHQLGRRGTRLGEVGSPQCALSHERRPLSVYVGNPGSIAIQAKKALSNNTWRWARGAAARRPQCVQLPGRESGAQRGQSAGGHRSRRDDGERRQGRHPADDTLHDFAFKPWRPLRPSTPTRERGVRSLNGEHTSGGPRRVKPYARSSEQSEHSTLERTSRDSRRDTERGRAGSCIFLRRCARTTADNARHLQQERVLV